MSRENPIRKTTGKGGNYRPTKSGAGMTQKGVAAYRKANPGSKLKTAVTGKAKKNWIQDVNKSIKKRKTKGKCTPITKKGCTGRAKALAKTFKKMAKKRKS